MVDIKVVEKTINIYVAEGKLIQTITFDSKSDLTLFLQDLTLTRILQYVS